MRCTTLSTLWRRELSNMGQDLLIPVPPWNDIHPWILRQTRIAQLKGFPAEYIRTTFRVVFDTFMARGDLRREITDRDIDQAISKVFSTLESPQTTTPQPMSYDPITGWCKVASPIRSELNERRVARALAESVVPELGVSGDWTRLFKASDLLCVGRSASDYFIVQGDKLHEITNAQFIVPNPLRKRLGTTQQGRLTSHCRDATGPRRYIVMENDHGMSSADQVKILFWVSAQTETPLRLIVSSGGKSIHGWFDTVGTTEEQIFEWVKFAVSVGFDPRLMLVEQFCRFPGGFRPDKNSRQEILYTNIP